MAYNHGNRYQMKLFPQSIEDYVSQSDPVRVYDAFVEALDFNELGIILDENQVGNPEYDPKTMVKLLVYGYSYGIRSSRKLERALYHNVSFIWLMGGLTPDHKTIANFRKNNKKALKNVLKQCARLCVKFGLIEGNTLFVDGSKIRANASIDNTWTQEKCEKYLKNIDEHIESILKECESIDAKELNDKSMVELNKGLQEKEALKSKVQDIMKELKEKELKSVNSTDPDCIKVTGRQGAHSGYNGQIVVDEKHGLIVSSDVVNKHNDRNQFAEQVEQANQTLGHKCQNACADAGYADTDELKKIDDQGINVIVPSQEQISETETKPFDKDQFKYDSQNDCYTCPQGHQLNYIEFYEDKNCNVYRIPKRSLCLSCKHFGVCTTSKRGRSIKRLINENLKNKLEDNYNKEESQAIFRLRKQKAELPFGHLKRNLGVNAFLLRGIDGVKAEMSLFASCFDVARMINIIGVPALVAKLMA
jgi:transposase